MTKTFEMLLTIGLSSAFCDVSIPSDSSKFDIFIMMGQSNMSGMAIVEAQDTVSNPRIYKWWNTEGWMPGQESFSQPYFGPCGLGGQCLGPSRAFAQTLVDSDQSITVGAANLAYPGSPIESWVKGGTYYQRNLDWIAQLRRGGTIRGIVWHQGEANTGPMTPSYGQVLAKMITDYRTDLGLPNLSFIAGTVGTTGLPTDNRINFALDSLQSAGFPYFRMVSSAGTSFQDNVHFDNVSQRLMGQRYAQAYLAMTSVSTASVRPITKIMIARDHSPKNADGIYDIAGRLLSSAKPGTVFIQRAFEVEATAGKAILWR